MMTKWTFIIRSLFHYRLANISVLLGSAIACAIIVGALVVGDSTEHSLKVAVVSRLGDVRFSGQVEGRFFRAKLAGEISEELSVKAAGVLRVDGIVSDGVTNRISNVQVIGVDADFWALSPSGTIPPDYAAGKIIPNRPLAGRLGLVGPLPKELVIRLASADGLSRDMPLNSTDDTTVTLRLPLGQVIEADDFGEFSLRANQLSPLSIFLPREVLARRLGKPGQANMLLVGDSGGQIDISRVRKAIANNLQLGDAGVEIKYLTREDTGHIITADKAGVFDGGLELRSRRVFLDDVIVKAATNPLARAFITYFVNSIELEGASRFTPYSFITAMSGGSLGIGIPEDLKDDEIVITDWLGKFIASDGASRSGRVAKVGDRVTVRYFVAGLSRKLIERERIFTVRKIIQLRNHALDKALLPTLPGISDVDSCTDWHLDDVIDTSRETIREIDQDYWYKHRGTPKAYISLSAGKEMWANRFGTLTAVRYPPGSDFDAISKMICKNIDPQMVGLGVVDVRSVGLRAVAGGQDFGELFIGLSFFLIASAILLTVMLFVFGITTRASQFATLRAIGYRTGQIRRLMLSEGLILVVLGVILGSPIGLIYTWVILEALGSVWSGAVASSEISFHAKVSSIVLGASIAMLVAAVSMWVTLRQLGKKTPRQLLSSGGENLHVLTFAKSAYFLIAGMVIIIASVVLAFVYGSGSESVAIFFIVGTMLLVGVLLLCYAALCFLARSQSGVTSAGKMTVTSLGLRNASRRRGRSIATIALLATGCFLVLVVLANRIDPLAGAGERGSGTGGFALYGESSIPIYIDLNSSDACKAYQLGESDLEDITFVQMSASRGDDASCLNLNRTANPRLLAVRPRQLSQLGAFVKPGDADIWPRLIRQEGDPTDVTFAIGDEATVKWGLGKKIGESLDYVDEQGRGFKVKIVATMCNSILQGNLIISESEFVSRYHSLDGKRVFLIDAPAAKSEFLAEKLTDAFADHGMVIMPAADRLRDFARVQNTYLSIFGVLGALGLLLGSIAMGIVVFKSVFERRSELAILDAIGFTKGSIIWMVLSEHWLLLALGVLAGFGCAMLAVCLTLTSVIAQIVYADMLVVLASLALAGGFWTSLAILMAIGSCKARSLARD